MPSNREMVVTKLQRIAEKARRDSGCRFTSLFHLMNVEMLRECFGQLRKDAAAGIDKVTKEEYAENLEENLTVLVEQLHRMAYIPQPVRRVYIPKAGSSKKRPLGIPAIEDKLVQAGLARILTAIYEQDFIDDSYGFRPGRSCHDALRALSDEVEGGRIHYIVDADIKGFFDNVDHEWLMKFLGHRIADKRVLRYVKRFLKAGIMEDGIVSASEKGTPQGGLISPILANIYLHYSLDLWFTRVFQKSSAGQSRIIRYADDFVVCFQCEDAATRFRRELDERLAKFGLEISPEKTKIIEFGPFAETKAKRGGGKAATFDFLGFTHYCSRSRNGRKFRMKRVTSRKKFAAKIRMFKEWLKANRTLPTPEFMEKVASKLRGHFAYYGVTDNSKGISRFAWEIRRLLFKWLNRRGRRGCMNWEKLNLFFQKFPLPRARIMVNLFA
ncbi:MAG: group II intron reverse transcriptase/maturase [Deltaproteobacteria bacterium]|nr:MAG: group II intron reverse transcriptase/maturase [Deltaproteobacteria bacterium]HDM58889.1 group II intron reverse transcriptase/maturase [Bacillota bacterium]